MRIPPPLPGMLVRLLLLPLCGAVLVVTGCSTTAGTDTSDDGHLVFCLSPAQGADLADAAVTLGLATPGASTDQVVVDHRQLSLQDWRARAGADFTRACNALVSSIPAAPTAASGSDMFLATLNALIPLLVGAVLGLATSGYRDSVIRRRLHADELESITEQFVATAGRFAHAWSTAGGTQPDGSPLLDVRWKLATSLRRASVLRPRCAQAVKETRSLVNGPVLGESLLDGWAGKDRARQLERVHDVERESARLTVETGQIAETLRRTRWSRHVPQPPDPVMSSGTGTAS